MKIFFIGAGPGDPELLTLKADRIIRNADIIIYAGSLVNSKLLERVKKGAEIHDSSVLSLEDIFKIFEKGIRSNKTIARLQSGDISIYSAVQEQIEWCERKKIDYELVPGVSSFQASSASLKTEFTLPGVTQTIILTRLSGKTKTPEKEDISKLAKINATLVVYLSIDRIETVVKKLRNGYKNNTPVAVVEKASWRGERKIYGTLKNISEKVKKAEISKHALIIVGNVLKKKFRRSILYSK